MDRAEVERLAGEIADDPEAFKGLVEQAVRAGSPADSPAGDPYPREPLPIQIWEPERIDGELFFTRPAPGPLGDHFAAVRSLRADKAPGVQRICLFGESAAAGYLYAPWLTPARELQGILDGAGWDRWEVIDLARTNETLSGMETALHRSLQLDPDVIAVFAGNNWTLLETPEISPHAPDARNRGALGRLLADGGLSGPVERAMRLRLERAGAFLAEVAAQGQRAGLRIVVVIPEVNLADWADWGPVAWLPGDGSARWHALFERAERHLQKGEWGEAFAAGEAMLALDEGRFSAGFQILAWAKAGMGEPEKASRAARAAVDALHYPLMCTLGAPRLTSIDRELLREGSRFHGFDLVDLPELFAAWTGDPYPGKRMFLDYCHLTVEGMRVAAAGIAEKVLQGTGRTWRDLATSAPEPNLAPEADASAKFGAALHTAHRMPGHHRRGEILEHWVGAALEADPGMEARLLDLVEARSSGGRIDLTPAHARNLAAAAPILYAHGWEYSHLDAAVVETILEVLVRLGSAGAERIAAGLTGATPNAGGVLELTDPYHLAEPLDRPFYELSPERQGEPRAFMRSFRPEISFVFLSGGRRSYSLRVCARLPLAADRGRTAIQINGIELKPMVLGQDWRAVERELSVSAIKPGINRLRLVWPPPTVDGDAALRAAADRLLAGMDTDLFPVFGELYSLRLAAAI
ncbi:MAG TPA: hypothetical protein VMN57_06520 [Anaerolineales bacterium]|nr:hypothetical protein [Anaerolineales bacterium]